MRTKLFRVSIIDDDMMSRSIRGEIIGGNVVDLPIVIGVGGGDERGDDDPNLPIPTGAGNVDEPPGINLILKIHPYFLGNSAIFKIFKI